MEVAARTLPAAVNATDGELDAVVAAIREQDDRFMRIPVELVVDDKTTVVNVRRDRIGSVEALRATALELLQVVGAEAPSEADIDAVERLITARAAAVAQQRTLDATTVTTTVTTAEGETFTVRVARSALTSAAEARAAALEALAQLNVSRPAEADVEAVAAALLAKAAGAGAGEATSRRGASASASARGTAGAGETATVVALTTSPVDAIVGVVMRLVNAAGAVRTTQRKVRVLEGDDLAAVAARECDAWGLADAESGGERLVWEGGAALGDGVEAAGEFDERRRCVSLLVGVLRGAVAASPDGSSAGRARGPRAPE